MNKKAKARVLQNCEAEKAPKEMSTKAKVNVRMIDRLKNFEITEAIINQWHREPASGKAAFWGALIIGFFSHLFVYTGRYFGRDDMGRIFNVTPTVGTGRWFNTVISTLSFGYVLPLVSGLFISFFIAAAALYICKILDIQKKSSAFLIAGLLSTFPSIANTNLFLYDSPNYHFAILLGSLAVYFTVKFRFGFIPGSILAMLTLAIYQSKFNVILALCLFYLLKQLLDDSKKLKDILLKSMTKLASMVVLGGILYAISLPISFKVFNTTFNNYRGMSTESISGRLLSVSGILSALKSTYKNFYNGFFGNIYLIIKELKYAYILLIALTILFVLLIVFNKKLYKQYQRMLLIITLTALIPFACNFSSLFDTGNAYGLMIYAFVIPLVFCVAISEQCKNAFPILKSVFSICIVFVIGNYIVGNNIYYLKAYFFNQRTTSLTTRILSKVDPLIPLSDSRQITFFGGLPNEYYPESNQVFREYGTIMDGSAVGGKSYINYSFPNGFSLSQFTANFDRLHGVPMKALGLGEERDNLASEVLRQNMPVWPEEGSVGIINGVIVVNFGISDVVLEDDGGEQYFRARHHVNKDNVNDKYEYSWQVYQNGSLIDSSVSSSDRFYLDKPSKDDSYRVEVTVINTVKKFKYPKASIEISVGDEVLSK